MEEKLENQRKDVKEAYIEGLLGARKYYLSCKKLEINPEKGLQKLLYDLGKKVNLGNELKAVRKFAVLVEEVSKLMPYLNIQKS